MGSSCDPCTLILSLLIGLCIASQCSASLWDTNALLLVNASQTSARTMPQSLFGVFFEEINHAGVGGLWAELVSNRGFESGGKHSPSIIDPWSTIGDETLMRVSTDLCSCFKRNPVALRMEVLCDRTAAKVCPAGGVGIYNPGYWGMNIEQGKTYKLIFYVRSLGPIHVTASLTDSTGVETLAAKRIVAAHVSNWTKMEVSLKANGTYRNSRLQLKTSRRGVIWFDQISLMPSDTYKGHGFRNDLFKMIADLKPGFFRFPGGSFVESESLRNAFRWKETVGPWEERPGHFNDAWSYWTDDGLGYFEFLQLAEDLGASPIWVFNSGISQQESVDPSNIMPFVQEVLEGIEFARGDSNSTWGSVRAAMGHQKPFDLKYVAVGNQDCWKQNYRGNYLKFYAAIRNAYPDIKIVSNCDGSNGRLDHPADLYDYHVYTDANTVFSMAHAFDRVSRIGPKVFVSEYAVTGNEAGSGTLLAALAEAGFLIGIEKNSDVVELASCAPLFVNINDVNFKPDAIVFDSYQTYGTPSYWMQQFFSQSSGATLLSSTLQTNSSNSLVASAIMHKNPVDEKTYLRVKVVNFGSNTVNLTIAIDGLDPNLLDSSGSSKTVLSSSDPKDENSFGNPTKVSPVQSFFETTGRAMDVVLTPHSLSSFDLLLASDFVQDTIDEMSYVSSI